jgi:hypothetical protein
MVLGARTSDHVAEREQVSERGLRVAFGPSAGAPG